MIRGVNATFNGPNSESDIADQVQMFNDAINSKPTELVMRHVMLLLCLIHCRQLKMPAFLLSALTPVFRMHLPDLFLQQLRQITIKQVLQQLKVFGGSESRVKGATGKVRIGVVNQDATSESITSRGLGFIDEITTLCKGAGKSVAVVGNDYYVGKVKEKVMKPLPTLLSKFVFLPRQQQSFAQRKRAQF